MKDLKAIWANPWTKFIAAFTATFFVSFTLLFVLGLVPAELRGGNSLLDILQMRTLESVGGIDTETVENTPAQNPGIVDAKLKGEEPLHLLVPAVKIDIIVQNPDTRDNTLLDEYLKKGTVRYPDSALLGDGNTLIFGHSSTLSVVNNKAYKAMNGLENLKRDDVIYVDSATSRYVFKVLTVQTANADEEYVNFQTKDAMLTLSTCNSFGKKESRHIVTAILDEKIALPY
jgi:LPXTG-site transpeptidase (sortase) family protein